MPQKCILLALTTLLAGIVSVGMGACEASSERRSSSSGQGEGEGEGEGQGEGEGDGEGAGQGEGGGRCAEKGFPITEQPVDMLIVLDRSSSMQDNGYWNPMCAALRTVTAQISDKINFGLMVFPQSGCGEPAGSCEPATAPIVDIGDPSAISLIDNALSPSGVGFCEFGATPTAETLKAAKTALAAVKNTNQRFVLLATDGAPNCNENLSCKNCTVVHNLGCGGPTHCLDDLATEAAAKDLYDAGYPVYVLGLGNLVAWQKEMNDIATAGGTNQYYPATDTASFVSTLETITQKVASCEFELSFDDLPPSASRDPALVNIYCKGSAGEAPGQSNVIRLDEGCANGHGWDWVDSNTLRLCDKACAKIRDGGCAVVSSTFGCQSVPI